MCIDNLISIEWSLKIQLVGWLERWTEVYLDIPRDWRLYEWTGWWLVAWIKTWLDEQLKGRLDE